jgi:hypothetical protein
MPTFEEDDQLFEEYTRYVGLTHGIPDDFDTWVNNNYGTSRKRSRSIKRNNGGRNYDY